MQCVRELLRRGCSESFELEYDSDIFEDVKSEIFTSAEYMLKIWYFLHFKIPSHRKSYIYRKTKDKIQSKNLSFKMELK